MQRLIILCLCIFSTACLNGSESMTLESIMADPEWIGRAPEEPIWSPDSTRIYFRRKQVGNSIRDWWSISIQQSDASPRKLSLPDVAELMPGKGDFDRAQKRFVFAYDGDLFWKDLDANEVHPLTQTAAIELSPRFLRDASSIQFVRDQTIFVRDLNSGLESQPAVFEFKDNPDDKQDGKPNFLTQKESELFDFLQKQKKTQDANKKLQREREKANTNNVDVPYYLGKDNELRQQRLAPNGKWMAVVVAAKDQREPGRSDKMPVWIREDGYTESREVRSLVGTPKEGNDSLLLLDLKNHKTFSIDLSELPGIHADPLAFLKNANGSKTEKEEPRDINIRTIQFSGSSKYLLFQCYSTDNKDRWICTLNVSGKRTPRVRVVHHRTDQAWINYRHQEIGWVGKSRKFYFISEDSGFAHLYVGKAKKGNAKQLTKGSFEVSQVQPSHDGKRIFFRCNRIHPGIYELFEVQLNSNKIRQVTELGGNNEFQISPNEKWAIATHSKINRPPELFLVSLSKNAKPKRMTRLVSEEFQRVDWVVPKIVEIPSRHGQRIYSKLYLPEQNHHHKRPAVVFVHGAGYLQNAHYGWSYYFREFMFHSLLVQRGYVVLDMDYRASAGYGRDWRTAIYRQMGTPELEDLEDGIRWLEKHHHVDTGRVGIYGGSYGGFMTLMALFKKPGMFRCGAALRPVTDWAHYNHSYTSNILNSPEIDPEAYENSSPIYCANGLQDPLLMCHGMLDDNVFFKDTVRLAQKLIELEKQDWEVAIYPVEPHGFRQPSSWLDEYRRVLKLFETHLSKE